MRTTKRLKRARARIANLLDEIQEYYWDFIVTTDLLELRNIATTAEIRIATASVIANSSENRSRNALAMEAATRASPERRGSRRSSATAITDEIELNEVGRGLLV